MKEEYYVVVDENNPYRLYFNEHKEGAQEEIMTKEHADYTSKLLGGCVVAKLVIEE